MVDLSIEIASIKFRNPVMNAAGPPGMNGDTLVLMAKGGAGGLVAKTISISPAAVPRPTIAVMERTANAKAMINVELWSDIPYTRWIEKEYKKAKTTNLPLIASIGYTKEELGFLGPLVEKAGVDAIECSIHYVGAEIKPLVEAFKELREKVGIPVFLKISPHVQDVAALVRALERHVDGFVAINTIGPVLSIDIETGKPFLGSKSGYGWLSGSAIKPLGIRIVSEVARTTDLPVIGVGGILSGRDAIEYIMAGAWGVQVCTAAILHGPKIFRKITSEMEIFMKNHGYNTIDEMRGLALKNLPSEPLRTYSLPPKIDWTKCNACFLCVQVCPWRAPGLKETYMGRKAIIDEKKCYGCGLCVSICPVRAIKFEE